MPSVEGLWCFMSATLEDRETYQFGGVAVFETGRVLGGDSHLAYVGEYTVDGAKVTARVRSYTWHPEAGGQNVFGMELPVDYWVIVEGERTSDRVIDGQIAPEGQPELALPIRLVLMHELG